MIPVEETSGEGLNDSRQVYSPQRIPVNPVVLCRNCSNTTAFLVLDQLSRLWLSVCDTVECCFNCFEPSFPSPPTGDKKPERPGLHKIDERVKVQNPVVLCKSPLYKNAQKPCNPWIVLSHPKTMKVRTEKWEYWKAKLVNWCTD